MRKLEINNDVVVSLLQLVSSSDTAQWEYRVKARQALDQENSSEKLFDSVENYIQKINREFAVIQKEGNLGRPIHPSPELGGQ